MLRPLLLIAIRVPAGGRGKGWALLLLLRRMCVYDFHVGHLRPLVAFVGAHGATDLATRHWPPVYAACCLTPLPPKAVTTLFVAASVVHFAEDGGPDGSIALHSLVGFVWLAFGSQRGLESMLAYLSLVHTPAHYARCWRRRRWCALGLAVVATALAGAVAPSLSVVCVNHAVQRLVVAHVACEWWTACRARGRRARAVDGVMGGLGE